MAANPALVRAYNGELMPAPFANEVFLLRRDRVTLDLNNLQTRSGKWSARGVVYLSNVRVVFVAEKADASGLAGYDFPLVYIHKDSLNQPIFGCNNLSGHVWPATEHGGPSGSQPPHKFQFSFKEGGIGTFYPMYYALSQRAKSLEAAARQSAPQPNLPQEEAYAETIRKAFVDPTDPSTVYLAQPVDESQRLNYQPNYAKNFGADEKYQPIRNGSLEVVDSSPGCRCGVGHGLQVGGRSLKVAGLVQNAVRLLRQLLDERNKMVS